ncbi:calcium-activated chloride channel regulator 2-like [Patiria miniata]|uniref:VWFA domain-containing protein n=1 Tax=Patiria miniata TaxID=46514 RepID=A0A914AAX3_PATMI|nr:calcium-activated chloride channel regulator 2-like [Patiria miniata]
MTSKHLLLRMLACYAVLDLHVPASSAITIEDNGYTNVVVAIQPDVSQSDELIDKIQEMFKEASIHLNRATNRRLFFRNVTILVPQTWPANNSGYLSHSEATLEDPDVIVTSSDGPHPSTPPYTRRDRGCGQEGLSINFVDAFLLDPNTTNTYASLGHVLLYEWGHYRWGLFDEFSDDEDNQFHHSSVTNQFEGVRCSYDITGTPMVVESDGIDYRPCYGNTEDGYEFGCMFIPTETQENATGSVMYGRGRYNNIVDFCDSDPGNPTNFHNREAPSRHNRLCDQRSNWAVMREHSDLKDGNNLPRELLADDLEPAFQIVRRGPRRVMLVLERSSYIAGETHQRMINAAAAFIWTVPSGVWLGLTWYNGQATPINKIVMVQVQSDNDRQTLLNALPTSTTGQTSIGTGLSRAIEFLQLGDSATANDRILLVNGFKENQFLYIEHIKEMMIKSKIIVDTVAVTSSADPQLAEVSQLTGGRFYYAPNDSGSGNSLNEALTRSVDNSDVSNSDKQLQIWSASVTVPVGESRSAVTYIDATIRKKTKFTITWVQTDTPNITLSDPDGALLTSSYPGYMINTTYGFVVYSVTGKAKEGPWTIDIQNTDPSLPTSVQVSLTSYPRDDDVPPISVSSSISELTKNISETEVPLAIFAEVRQGYSQVVVNATVMASVSIPGQMDPVEIQLVDTGTGADIISNDGIYSGYFTKYTVDGLYSVEVRVENSGHATVAGFPFSFGVAGRNLNSQAPIFQRVVSAGSSRVFDVPGTDVFPPAKVTDLRVVDSSFPDRTVILAWTATGDDFDNGEAASYEVTRGVDVDSILTGSDAVTVRQSDILSGNLTDPQSSGATEEFTVIVPVVGDVSPLAFAVVVRDEAGLASPRSNIALVAVRRFIPGPTTLAPPTTTPTGIDSTASTNGTTQSYDTTVLESTPSSMSISSVRSTQSMVSLPSGVTTPSKASTLSLMSTLSGVSTPNGVSTPSMISAPSGMSTPAGASTSGAISTLQSRLPSPVTGTEEPILSRDAIIIASVLGSIGLVTAVAIGLVSLSKLYSSHKVTPSRPGSERSTDGLWDPEKQEEDSLHMTDLDDQGIESEV